MDRPSFGAGQHAVDGFNIDALTRLRSRRIRAAARHGFLHGRRCRACTGDFRVRRARDDLFLGVNDGAGPSGGQPGLAQDRTDLVGQQPDRQDVAEFTIPDNGDAQGHELLADRSLVRTKPAEHRLSCAQHGVEAFGVGYRSERGAERPQHVQHLLLIRLRQCGGLPQRAGGHDSGCLEVEITQIPLIERGRACKRLSDLQFTGNLAFDPVRHLRQRFGGGLAGVASFLIRGDIGHPSPEKQDRNGGRENERREKPDAFLWPA